MTIITLAWYRVRLRAMMQSGRERTNREVTMPGPRAGRDRRAEAEVNRWSERWTAPRECWEMSLGLLQLSTPTRWRYAYTICYTHRTVYYAYTIAVNIAPTQPRRLPFSRPRRVRIKWIFLDLCGPHKSDRPVRGIPEAHDIAITVSL